MSDISNKTVLVTGGNGYVGRQIVAALKDRAKKVISCDVIETPVSNRIDGVIYARADIRDASLRKVFDSEPVDVVVHLASIVTPGKNSSREFEYSVDVEGTKNVLDACVATGVKQIIVSSSGAAYGYHADNSAWLKETDPLRGNYEIPYSWHKRVVEEMLGKFRDTNPELKQTIFRISTVLGKTVDNQITALFYKPRLIGVQGSDTPFVFIWDQDLVEVFLQAILKEKVGIFNVAGTGALTIDEIARRLSKKTLKLPALFLRNMIRVMRVFKLTHFSPEQAKFIQYRPVLDNKKLMTEFPYEPKKTSSEVFDFWLSSHPDAKKGAAKIVSFAVFLLLLSGAQASTGTTSGSRFMVTDDKGKPIESVMVYSSAVTPSEVDRSDNGYSKPGVLQRPGREETAFTDRSGGVTLPSLGKPTKFRFRKYGYKDFLFEPKVEENTKNSTSIRMTPEKDPFLLAASKPANVWLGALDFKDVSRKFPDAKKHFQMQCGYCHQQGNLFTRQERTPEDWKTVIGRMVTYGSRLPSDLQAVLPEVLPAAYRELRENPKLLAEPMPFSEKQSDKLSGVKITEWPIGDSMSQEHDLILLDEGRVLVGDNIQDRIYEVNTKEDSFRVHKVPHRSDEKNGGLVGARLKAFPKHESFSNVHSFARSARDGHVFLTPSAQRRLIEFDPKTGAFMLYEMPGGFYPHTIRIDQEDRVWFTLALSNQIAMFNRQTQKFILYDLPARGLKEKIITSSIRWIYALMNQGIPLTKWLKIDWESTGLPLPYGIDITPDGKVWFARLHTQEIGAIDPKTGGIELFRTPALGPRRLRSDAEGNLWIAHFGDSSISRFDPRTKTFKQFDLPVNPKGSETPYSLNVDLKRNYVWVTGNQSDSLFRFNPKTEEWLTIPLPRRSTFTRDIEFDEEGRAYASNSNFPAWHIEGAQPTLIRVEVPEREVK